MNKKIILGLSLVLIIIFAISCSGVANASVNDFVIKDFQADYYLDKDNEGRSTLKTVERITAEFPEYDQNHGIERAIPKKYDGHSVSLRIDSIKDEAGNDYSYSEYGSNDNLILRIGDADIYVHGSKTYVITYYQRDVTKYFSDTNNDEFYWDTNGTEWLQDFEKVTASIHLSQSVASSLNGGMACYYGVFEANNECKISKLDDTISAEVSDLSATENMTISIGFKKGTFAAYRMSKLDIAAGYMPIAEIIVWAITFIYLIYLRIMKYKDAPRTHAIVPEYLPPKFTEVALSSVILKKSSTWVAAAFIDLAVRHNIKIIEVGEKKWWSKQKYALEFVSDDKLSLTEGMVISGLFGGNPSVGDKYEIKPNRPDTKLFTKLRTVYQIVSKSCVDKGYQADVNKLIYYVMVAVIFFVIPLAINIYFGTNTVFSDEPSLFVVMSIIAVILGIAAIMLIVSIKPLTPKGRELYDYLKGLELYISVGEKERLKILQSPEGAEKTPIDISDKTKLVHLYERVLPYAVLFGQEEGWTKVLGEYYEQQNTQPDWYLGHAAFNAAIFSSMMSDFSSSVARSSYSSSSSSSSGGSSGGGFSGGGGGGGGGGGW